MGWSTSMEIENNADHFVESNYKSHTASWFQRSWWTRWSWGWIYTNDTSVPVKLKKAVFSACAGHSNGKQYMSGSGNLLVTDGYGCTFTSDIYVIDSAGKRVGKYENVGSCDIPSISSFNCSYGGVRGNTSTTSDQTSFGNPAYFDPPLCRMPRTVAYTQAPAVPPGGKMFVVIRPTAWKTSSQNALLVMKGDSANFSSELEPENNDYIWIFKKKDGDTVPKWYKEKRVHMKISSGWKEM